MKFLFDTTNLWQEKKHFPLLYQPSVTDLNQDASRFIIEKYEKEIILPACKYFNIITKINEFQNDTEKNHFVLLIINGITPILVAVNLIRTELIPWNWLCILIAYAICISSSIFLIPTIYKHTPLSLHQYNNYENDFEHIEKFFEQRKCTLINEFPIAEENARNNFFIRNHMQYIYSIKDTIIFRHYLRKVIYFIVGVVYISSALRIY